MLALDFHDLSQHSDILRLRSGQSVTARFVEPGDAAELQAYFRGLSSRSRYNRFLGAVSELPRTVLEKSLHVGEDGGFSVVVTTKAGDAEIIIGEARYAFEAPSARFEFGLSVDDRWQGQGIGAALLSNLQCRAAAFGAGKIFGDTLRSNEAMIGLARKAGFSFSPTPNDWKLVRFEKLIAIAPAEIPCASWRLAAGNQLSATAALAH